MRTALRHRAIRRYALIGLACLTILSGAGAAKQSRRRAVGAPVKPEVSSEASAAAEGRVTDVRFWSVGEATRVAVEIDHAEFHVEVRRALDEHAEHDRHGQRSDERDDQRRAIADAPRQIVASDEEDMLQRRRHRAVPQGFAGDRKEHCFEIGLLHVHTSDDDACLGSFLDHGSEGGAMRAYLRVVDPGQAFGTGAHPTTRLCIEALIEIAGRGDPFGPLTDLGCGSGVLAIAAGKLGWRPLEGCDNEVAAVEAARENARVNGVEAGFDRIDLKSGLPALAPTTVANLTAPLLEIVANGLSAENLPETLICSGLLTTEYDRVLAAFGPHGLVETGRGAIGDWGSLVFAREGSR